MLETTRLYLRELEEKDELDIVKWRNQPEVIDKMFNSAVVTLEGHRAWFQKYSACNDRKEFVIIKKEDDMKIGSIGLSKIDYINRNAEYGILIGEKEESGKGYAKEASKALLGFGFRELNMRKIYLKVFTDNVAALKLYEWLGFFKEGILRKEILKEETYKDVLVMSILIEEWELMNV